MLATGGGRTMVEGSVKSGKSKSVFSATSRLTRYSSVADGADGAPPKFVAEFYEKVILLIVEKRRALAQRKCLEEGVEVAPSNAEINDAVKLFFKRQQQMKKEDKMQLLIDCGNRLLELGEWTMASSTFFTEAAKVSEAQDEEDAVQGVMWRTEAEYGLAACEMEAVRCRDVVARYPRTAQKLLDCLRRVQKSMSDLLALPPKTQGRWAWLILNGCCLIHKVAEPLANKEGGAFSRHSAEFLLWAAEAMDACVSLSTTRYLPYRCRLYALAIRACEEARRPKAAAFALGQLRGRLASLRAAEEMQLPLPRPTKLLLDVAETDVKIMDFCVAARDLSSWDDEDDAAYIGKLLDEKLGPNLLVRARALFEASGRSGQRGLAGSLEQQEKEEKKKELSGHHSRSLTLACASLLLEHHPQRALLSLPLQVELTRQLFVMGESETFAKMTKMAKSTLPHKQHSPRSSMANNDEDDEEELVEGASEVLMGELDLLEALEAYRTWTEEATLETAQKAADLAQAAKDLARAAKKELQRGKRKKTITNEEEQEEEVARLTDEASRASQVAERAAEDGIRAKVGGKVAPVARARALIKLLAKAFRKNKALSDWRPDLLTDTAIFLWRDLCVPIILAERQAAAEKQAVEEEEEEEPAAAAVPTKKSLTMSTLPVKLLMQTFNDQELSELFVAAASAVDAVLTRLDVDDALLRARVALALGSALRDSSASDLRKASCVLSSAIAQVDLARSRSVRTDLHGAADLEDHLALARQSVTCEVDDASTRAAQDQGRLGAHGYGGTGIFGAGSALDLLHQALAAVHVDLVITWVRVELDLGKQIDTLRKLEGPCLAAEAMVSGVLRKHGAARGLAFATMAADRPDSEQCLEDALECLKGAAKREEELLVEVADFSETTDRTSLAVALKSKSPPAPMLLSRSDTRITLQPRRWKPLLDVEEGCHMRCLGKAAGAADVSLTTIGSYAGLGVPLVWDAATGRCEAIEVSGLCPNESYVFAVALYSEKGEPVTSVGQTSICFEAINPLPLPLCYAYIAEEARKLGCEKQAAKAATFVYLRLVDVDDERGHRLRQNVLKRASPAELTAFVACAHILADRPDNGGLPTAFAPGINQPLYDDGEEAEQMATVRLSEQVEAQMSLYTKVAVLLCAVQIAAELSKQDPEQLVDAVHRCYRAMAPLLSLRLPLLADPLVQLREALWLVSPTDDWDDATRSLIAKLSNELTNLGLDLSSDKQGDYGEASETQLSLLEVWAAHPKYGSLEPAVLCQSAGVTLTSNDDGEIISLARSGADLEALEALRSRITKAREAEGAWEKAYDAALLAKREEEEDPAVEAPPVETTLAAAEATLRLCCKVGRLLKKKEHLDVLFESSAVVSEKRLSPLTRRVIAEERSVEIRCAAHVAASIAEISDQAGAAQRAAQRTFSIQRKSSSTAYLLFSDDDDEQEESELTLERLPTRQEQAELRWLSETELLLGASASLEEAEQIGNGPLTDILECLEEEEEEEEAKELSEDLIIADEDTSVAAIAQRASEAVTKSEQEEEVEETSAIDAVCWRLARASRRARWARSWRQLCSSSKELWNLAQRLWISPLAFKKKQDPGPWEAVSHALLDLLEIAASGSMADDVQEAGAVAVAFEEDVKSDYSGAAASEEEEAEEEEACVVSESALKEALDEVGVDAEWVAKFAAFALKSLICGKRWSCSVKLARRLLRSEAVKFAANDAVDNGGGCAGEKLREAIFLATHAQQRILTKAQTALKRAEDALTNVDARLEETVKKRLGNRRQRPGGRAAPSNLSTKSPEEESLERRRDSLSAVVSRHGAKSQVAVHEAAILKAEAERFTSSRPLEADALDSCRTSKLPTKALLKTYRAAQRVLRERRSPLILAQALQDDADICLADGDLRQALKGWREALDALFSTSDTYLHWQTITNQLAGIQEGARTASEVPAVDCGLCAMLKGPRGCLIAVTVIGKLLRFGEHDMDLRASLGRFAAACARAAFSTTLPHPTLLLARKTKLKGKKSLQNYLARDIGFAVYNPRALHNKPLSLFGSGRRLSPVSLSQALRSSALALLAHGRPTEALPLCCLLDHVSLKHRRNLRATAEARLLRVRVLTACGLVAEAASILASLIKAADLPGYPGSPEARTEELVTFSTLPFYGLARLDASQPTNTDAASWISGEEQGEEQEDETARELKLGCALLGPKIFCGALGPDILRELALQRAELLGRGLSSLKQADMLAEELQKHVFDAAWKKREGALFTSSESDLLSRCFTLRSFLADERGFLTESGRHAKSALKVMLPDECCMGTNWAQCRLLVANSLLRQGRLAECLLCCEKSIAEALQSNAGYLHRRLLRLRCVAMQRAGTGLVTLRESDLLLEAHARASDLSLDYARALAQAASLRRDAALGAIGASAAQELMRESRKLLEAAEECATRRALEAGWIGLGSLTFTAAPFEVVNSAAGKHAAFLGPDRRQRFSPCSFVVDEESTPPPTPLANLYLEAVPLLASLKCSAAENLLDLHAAALLGEKDDSLLQGARCKCEEGLATLRHTVLKLAPLRSTLLLFLGRCARLELVTEKQQQQQQHEVCSSALEGCILASLEGGHDHSVMREASLELVSLYGANQKTTEDAETSSRRLQLATHHLLIAANLAQRRKRLFVDTATLSCVDLPFLEFDPDHLENMSIESGAVPSRLALRLLISLRRESSDLPGAMTETTVVKTREAACRLHTALLKCYPEYKDHCCLPKETFTLDGPPAVPESLVCVQWLPSDTPEVIVDGGPTLPSPEQGVYPTVEAYVILGLIKGHARFGETPHLLKVNAASVIDLRAMQRRCSDLRYAMQRSLSFGGPSDLTAEFQSLLCDVHLFLNPHSTNQHVRQRTLLDSADQDPGVSCDMETLVLLEHFFSRDLGARTSNEKLCYFLRDIFEPHFQMGEDFAVSP